MRTFVTLGASLIVFVIAACSSSSDENTTDRDIERSTIALEETCQLEHAAELACGGTAATEADVQLPRCLDNTTPCIARLMRPEIAEFGRDNAKLRKCAMSKGESPRCECTPAEDVTTPFLAALAVSPAAAEFEEACNKKRAACGPESNSFSDDECLGRLYRDPVITTLRPCLDLACGNETIFKCLRDKRFEATDGKCSPGSK